MRPAKQSGGAGRGKKVFPTVSVASEDLPPDAVALSCCSGLPGPRIGIILRGSPFGGLMRILKRSLLVAAAIFLSRLPATGQENSASFPDLELAGADGGAVRLSQLKGNVVLLNVWATWCRPCRMELPIVQKMYDKYSDRNFVVLAVNIDADRRRVEPFMKRYNISLPIYFAAPEDAGQMTALGIPTTFLLSSERKIIDSQVGYTPEVEEHWKQLIEKHSKPRKPAR